jgi:DNA-binding response OmpR family regulator
MAPTIAIIDDDSAFQGLMHDFLSDEGFLTEGILSARGAVDAVRRMRPDLVILDLRLEQPGDGLRILEELRGTSPAAAIPVIICSADVHCLREQTTRLEQQGYLLMEKPLRLDALLASIGALLAPSYNERGG